MLALAQSRLPAALVLALLLALPVSCAPSNDLGGDPCLLQQYQGRSQGILTRMQTAFTTLVMHADALAPRQGTIDPSQDISETLTALAEFQLSLGAAWNLLLMGAHPQEGATFERDTYAAVQKFDTGAQLLTQAYVDAGYGDMRTAAAITATARAWIDGARLALGRAAEDVAALHTFSVNC